MTRCLRTSSECLESWNVVLLVTLFHVYLEWWTHNQWCVKLAVMTAFCVWTTAVRLLAEVFGFPTQNRKCDKRGQFSLVQENVLGCRLLTILRLRLQGASMTPCSLALKDAQTEWRGLCWDFWITRNMYSCEFHCTFPFRYFFSLLYNHFIPGWNSGGGEIFHCRPDRPWDPPSLP